MKYITVSIEIPESEYKDWGDYETDGEVGVKFQLISDFKEACRRLYIENYELNVNIDG
jgi:hypothetical protein